VPAQARINGDLFVGAQGREANATRRDEGKRAGAVGGGGGVA
jgi:hypothetical protein